MTSKEIFETKDNQHALDWHLSVSRKQCCTNKNHIKKRKLAIYISLGIFSLVLFGILGVKKVNYSK